ncbi:hypothetical protein [Sorangium sp. So ce341]|uniref:hypothetical protein n=1 Tax=Sorangium sp. So ce341 TaxID=3133302 RepID=UPI003F63AF1C
MCSSGPTRPAQGQHRGVVIARMDDPSPALRAAVLELLADDASAVDLARARLRDSDARVRAAAAAAPRRRAPTDRGVTLVDLVEEMGLATGADFTTLRFHRDRDRSYVWMATHDRPLRSRGSARRL